MRLLEQPVPEFAANRIIEAYVKVLEATNQVRRSFIPFSRNSRNG